MLVSEARMGRVRKIESAQHLFRTVIPNIPMRRDHCWSSAPPALACRHCPPLHMYGGPSESITRNHGLTAKMRLPNRRLKPYMA